MDRNDFLKSSISFLDHLDKRKLLEVQFKDEAGTGLGPTLGFYSDLGEVIFNAEEKKLWKETPENTLYPRPMSFKGLEPGRVKQILEIFKLAGTFVAKSIVDDRRMELPISSLMWDVLFDKVSVVKSE